MVVQGAPAWLSIGRIIAIIVLVLAILFVVLNRLDIVPGALIAGLALALLL